MTHDTIMLDLPSGGAGLVVVVVELLVVRLVSVSGRAGLVTVVVWLLVVRLV